MKDNKLNEIKAGVWIKTLTKEQLDKWVVLRDNWGDAIVEGDLNTLIKNHWISLTDNIDIDKTDIVNNRNIFFRYNLRRRIKMKDKATLKFGTLNLPKIAIGSGLLPHTINFTVGNQSAILMIGNYTYDLRTVNILQYDNIVIDGVTYKKVNKDER